tara:strand:- start:78 stop:389 length:312 start_codon:yes stop_codon:yes gene_type:complete
LKGFAVFVFHLFGFYFFTLIKELMAHVHLVVVVHMQTPQIAPCATSVIQATLQKVLGHTIVPYAQQGLLKQIELNVFHVQLVTYLDLAPQSVIHAPAEQLKMG